MSENYRIFDKLDKNIDGDVYTDELWLYMLSTDGSIFRKKPACVVYPKNSKDVIRTVNFAHKYGMTIHPRGSGSGLCGSALGGGIVLDFTKYMNRLIRIDTKDKSFECQPGYRFGQLAAELTDKHLFFPPDPSSGEYASFGGMYGTNASGAHSVKYGNVSDYVLDAEIVLSDGQVITLSDIERRDYADLPENLQMLSRIYTKNVKKIVSAVDDRAGVQLTWLF